MDVRRSRVGSRGEASMAWLGRKCRCVLRCSMVGLRVRVLKGVSCGKDERKKEEKNMISNFHKFGWKGIGVGKVMVVVEPSIQQEPSTPSFPLVAFVRYTRLMFYRSYFTRSFLFLHLSVGICW